MNNGYKAINLPFIISLTACPHGVKNTHTNEIITRNPSTILETTTKTYVVEEELRLDGTPFIHVNLSKILDEKNAKKSDYRPHHRELGTILINQEFIISRTLAENGVFDNNTGNEVSSIPSTIIETITKTYVTKGIYHYDTYSKFLSIQITEILASAPTKKADYISK